MLLRLEESVEVPEGALHVPIRRHLREAHLEEDIAELNIVMRLSAILKREPTSERTFKSG